MKRFTGRGSGRDVEGQLQLTWSGAASMPPATTPQRTSEPMLPAIERPPVAGPTRPRPDGLTLRLKWDFSTTFPPPTEQAIESGRIEPEEAQPDNVKSIHEEHAREMLMTLHDLEAVQDARRRGVDPRNNKAPMLAEAKERLRKFFETEPARLERSYQTLLAVYEEVFGDEAASAFDKAVRAWHAGVEVVADNDATPTPNVPAAVQASPTVTEPIPEPRRERPKRQHHAARISARLPVPRPLPSAIAAGHFGSEENGKPLRPDAREIREITETHAEKLIGIIDQLRCAPAAGRDRLQGEYAAAMAAYAEDFGERATRQLEAYVTRLAGLDAGSRRGR